MAYKIPKHSENLKAVHDFLSSTLAKLESGYYDNCLGNAAEYVASEVQRITIYSRLVDQNPERPKRTRKPRTTTTKTEPAKLPRLLVLLGRHDSGEYGNAACPHCGALGRYTYSFLCEDGQRYGAMSGCIKLFPKADPWLYSIIEKAFDKEQDAKDKRTKLASWWTEMIEAVTEVSNGKITVGEMRSRVKSAESRRQAWLTKNGYGKFRR